MRDLPAIIPTAEILLEPYVEADEEVAAAHLFNLQLRRARAPVTPGNRDRCPRVTADDRL